MAATLAVKTKSAPRTAPALEFDEELWFGQADNSAAEAAAASSMAALAAKVVGAKPFPESARKLAELSSRDDTRVDDYVRVIELDPALSAQLLRMVNAAGFALRQRCTSVRHAVTILGSKRLYQIATTAAVLHLFETDTGHAVGLLEHSNVMGAFSRYLGAHVGLPAEDLFTIGALHDIGKIMLLESHGERYRALLEQTHGRADALHLLERAEFGFDHGVLAAHVLKAWNIPDPVPKIVAWHHEPARAYSSSTAHAALVQTVRLADVLSHAIASGAGREHVADLATHEAASYLDISEAQLGAMWNDLENVYERALKGARGDEQDEQPEAKDEPLRAALKQRAVVEVPKQFPCVECGQASYGATCPACKGELCAKHPVGPAGYCGLCATDFETFEAGAPFPLARGQRYAAAFGSALLLAMVVVLLMGLQRATMGNALLAGAVTALFGAAAFTVLRRSILRVSFLRNRPPRSGAAIRGAS